VRKTEAMLLRQLERNQIDEEEFYRKAELLSTRQLKAPF